MSSLNKYFKYADDSYLVVPGSNASSIPPELQCHAEWAAECNLKLNPSKTSEIIFKRKNFPNPPLNHGIQRQEIIKILGVHVDNKLSFDYHVSETVKTCMQTLFALKTMKLFGLQPDILRTIFKSLVMSKLLYASPSWWGFISKQNREKLESFLNKAIKFGYYGTNDQNVYELQNASIEKKLFENIISNQRHALYGLLPTLKPIQHNLRPRGHNFNLPPKDDRNFITRCVYNFR